MDLKTWPPDSFIRRRRDIAAGGLDIPGPRVYLGPGYTRDAGTPLGHEQCVNTLKSRLLTVCFNDWAVLPSLVILCYIRVLLRRAA